MSTKEKITPGKPSPQGNSTTRRGFIGMGMKGLALLPYVAPIIETYLIGSARADDDDDDDDDHRISRPPKEDKKKSKMKRTKADEL
ncbi:MAG: hypothetical protein HZB37_06755 [Planctomycetes bacterium]|nr:hypothetical protein [Planctomycetota bacterium]